LGSTVRLKLKRVVIMLPVDAHVPVAGLYSCALAK
jgi:hypothetical protein